jgi:hypothetical protein
MEVHRGDRLVIEGTRVGQGRRRGEVLRVAGDHAHPWLTVRWDDGHESTLIPGPGVKTERHRGAPKPPSR